MKITVVGGGRMGLPLACVFGKHGAMVTVSDIDSDLVRKINRGVCPYEEPGLPRLMEDLHKRGLIKATTDTTLASSDSDVIIVIVPAHLTSNRDIDFKILQQATAEIGKGLKRGTLIVYETTVAVGGTRRNLIPFLENFSKLKAGEDFFVAYSPERVKANLVLERLETTPKVVGGFDDPSCKKAVEFYKQYLGAPVYDVGTMEAAEMTKLLGMLYRDVNIAFSNELAAFCEVSGIDFDRICMAANTDGEANLLSPGIGVGGHCVPVYPYFLTRESTRLGIPQILSEAAREINDRQPVRQLQRIQTTWKLLRGEKTHILGLGFRPEVKVDTFSPAYELRDELNRLGALVSIEDPYYSEDELQKLGFESGTIESARVIILCTAHKNFANPDFNAWKKAGIEVILDGRNFWSRNEVEAAGILYLGIGRSSSMDRR